MHVVAVMTIYSIVIAIFKDLPDISGDAIHGIRTIGIQLGVKTAFSLCVFLLFLAQTWGAVHGFHSGSILRSSVLITSHVLGVVFVLTKAFKVDLLSSASLHAYYMFIWKVIYFPLLSSY
mmetsp:Transcript_1595/g.5017  ORF Transcript_1595/g.5017 Transcript_1595/m.5017 type:complete len:120 (+) Transcript_1595:816-1175(+)